MEHAGNVVRIDDPTEWSPGRDLRQGSGATLKGTSYDGQYSTQLYTSFAAQGGGRPANEQTSDSSASTVETVCRRNGVGGLSSIPRFSLLRKVKIVIPTGLPDGTADNSRTVAICLELLVEDSLEDEAGAQTDHRPEGDSDGYQLVVRTRMRRDSGFSHRHGY